MCFSLSDGFVSVPLCLRYGWMLGLRSSSLMPSAWVASPRWEVTTNTTTTATSKDRKDDAFSTMIDCISVNLLFNLTLQSWWEEMKRINLLIRPIPLHYMHLSVCFFSPGIASPSVSWTVAPVSLQALPSSPSWASCPTSRTCLSQKWLNLVGFSPLSGLCGFDEISARKNNRLRVFSMWK